MLLSGLRSFLQAMPLWLRDKLWMREKVSKQCGFRGKMLFTEHHGAHAASAFFPSPFDSAAVLTIVTYRRIQNELRAADAS